jgi:hypothetical protein
MNLHPSILVGAFAIAAVTPLAAQTQPISVAFPADGHDLELDVARNRLYVSTPTIGEIQVVSTFSWQVIATVRVPPQPRGIDMSHDGTELFVAVGQAGALATIDLETLTVTETLPIGAELGDARTWDVLESRPGRVLVTGNPSSSGLAWVVEVDRNRNNTITRVAGDRIIRAEPTFAVDPTGRFVFIAEGFSPNSMYRLDPDQAGTPIVSEDDHGSVNGTIGSVVSPDGSRILTRSGQLLNSVTIRQNGQLTGGAAAFTPNGDEAWINTAAGTIEVWNVASQARTRSFTLACPPPSPFTQARSLTIFPDGQTALLLVNNVLCGFSSTVPPCQGPLPCLASAPVAVGQPIDLLLRSQSIYAPLLITMDIAERPVPIAHFGTLRLDPLSSTAMILADFTGRTPGVQVPWTNSTGSWFVSLSIPSSVHLGGMTLHFEAIVMDFFARNGLFRQSNLLTVEF